MEYAQDVIVANVIDNVDVNEQSSIEPVGSDPDPDSTGYWPGPGPGLKKFH